MNPCGPIQDQIMTDYIDGLLNDERRAAIDTHLGACADCRAVLAAVRKTEAVLQAAPLLTPPPHLWEGIRSQVDAAAERAALPSWHHGLAWLFSPSRRTVFAGLATVLLLSGISAPLISGHRTAALSDEAGASLIALIDERDAFSTDNELDLGTAAEYLLTTTGDII